MAPRGKAHTRPNAHEDPIEEVAELNEFVAVMPDISQSSNINGGVVLHMEIYSFDDKQTTDVATCCVPIKDNMICPNSFPKERHCIVGSVAKEVT